MFGIMFHHFHDPCRHYPGQGSLDADTFYDLLRFLRRRYTILGAEEWLERAGGKTGGDSEICLTFDDSLACQYDVALPVLQNENLTAFWFVYSLPLAGVPARLEAYRDFRTRFFPEMDAFYQEFFSLAKELCAQQGIDMDARWTPFENSYMIEHVFYSPGDRKFRFIRDKVLGKDKYFEVMDSMLAKHSYDWENCLGLWLSSEQLRSLSRQNHIIGLHSHSHPTEMASLPPEEQRNEYRTNKDCLESVLGTKVTTISYPNNSYNADTENIMAELGITVGFDALMRVPCQSPLHFPRWDHALVVREMRM